MIVIAVKILKLDRIDDTLLYQTELSPPLNCGIEWDLNPRPTAYKANVIADAILKLGAP